MLLYEARCPQSPNVEALPEEEPAVFTIAASERHDRDLPLLTNSILLEENRRPGGKAFGRQRFVCPATTNGTGNSHHLDFPGAISAEPRLHLNLLVNELACFLAHGFRRLILLNGRGCRLNSGVIGEERDAVPLFRRQDCRFFGKLAKACR